MINYFFYNESFIPDYYLGTDLTFRSCIVTKTSKYGLPNQRQEMSGNVRKRHKLNFSIFHDVFVIIMNNSAYSIRFFHFILYFDQNMG